MEAIPFYNRCLLCLHSIFHLQLRLLSARGLSHFENQVTEDASLKASKN